MPDRIEKSALILVMCLGGLLMWTAVPAAWLWFAGRFARVSQSDMSSFAVLYTGTAATMYAIGLGLGRFERRYVRRFGIESGPRVVGAPWLASLRGDTPNQPPTVLDKILIINVGMALATAAIWFLLFSHGSQAPR